MSKIHPDLLKKQLEDCKSVFKDMKFISDEMEEENKDPDFYYCNCCGHDQIESGMGNSCDNCGMFNVMEEGYY